MHVVFNRKTSRPDATVTSDDRQALSAQGSNTPASQIRQRRKPDPFFSLESCPSSQRLATWTDSQLEHLQTSYKYA